MTHTYGELNAFVVGSLMKEAVRRAILAIRAQRFTFEARVKGEGPKGSVDLVTTADQAAQRVFVKLLNEWFPTFGVVAEEDHLTVPCTEQDRNLWFSVDPLDGTKAFVRRQSHGIGTMISLICDGEVIAACVGDVMTQEVYATRPGSADVFRISEFGFAEALSVEPERPLADQWLQLRERPSAYSRAIQEMVAGADPLFKDYETTGGSIGISMARLWKGEMAGEVIRAGMATPWDLCPVVGILAKLGFVFVAIDATSHDFAVVHPPIEPRPVAVPHELLVIHESRLSELMSWRERFLQRNPAVSGSAV